MDIKDMKSILVNDLFELFPVTDGTSGDIMYWITDADKAVEDFGMFTKAFVDGFIDLSTGRYDCDALEEAIWEEIDRNNIEWNS